MHPAFIYNNYAAMLDINCNSPLKYILSAL